MRPILAFAAVLLLASAAAADDAAPGVVFLASGTESSVHISNEARTRSLSDPGAAAFADVHTHPLTNGAYFGGAQAYEGEIMFADEAAVASRRELAPE